MPLVFSTTGPSQDLQQTLQSLVQSAQSISIPPIQAVYDPRQLEALYQQTHQTLEEALGALERAKRRTPLKIDAGAIGADFGLGEVMVDPVGLDQEHSEIVNPLTPSIDQTAQQLRQSAQGLQVELIHADPPSLIGACARVKGSLIKCSVTLERQVCAHTGAKAALTHHMDEEGALAVRHAYAIFRRALRPLHTSELPALEEMLPLMARAKTALDTLCAESIFPRMYYRDRLQSLELRRRVQLWLDEPTDMAVAEALRAELITMSDNFRAINRRQELIEHDQRLLQELLGRWSNIEERSPVEDEHYEAISPLFGCDPLLDSWIVEHPRVSFALMLPALRALRGR